MQDLSFTTWCLILVGFVNLICVWIMQSIISDVVNAQKRNNPIESKVNYHIHIYKKEDEEDKDAHIIH